MFKILSIFTGAGGLDLGFHGDFNFLNKNFKKLPFKTKVALELSPYACETLKENKIFFENTTILNENILTFNKKEIEGEFDVLLGGFPCVTFSMVGKRKGVVDNINGQLYESFAEYVEYFKPKIFLAENVKGMLSANNGEAIKIIKERFERTGYNLKIFLVNFANFGVPQLRERVLFIGIRNDIKTEFIPPEIILSSNKFISTEEAFKNLNNKIPNHNFLKQTERVKQRLKAIPEGGNFKDLPPELAIKGMMSNIYRRLDRNKPLYTILASGGGGTWTYHYKEPRALTNRERARIQGFPDSFIFKGSNIEVRRQIGNAVPPVGIYPFAKRIENVLKGEVPKYNQDKIIKELKI